MDYYSSAYRKRVNRYGNDYKTRLENGRRKNFDRFLKQSPHSTIFTYIDENKKRQNIECVLEPYKEDQSQSLMHLLCRADVEIPVGTVGSCADERYMLWYPNPRLYSGYNRYCLVRMNTKISWWEDDNEYTSDAYLYYQQDNMLKHEIKSRSRIDTLYLENLKLNFLLLPATPHIHTNTYIEIPAVTGEVQAFRVTGYDVVSTPHVMYVSMDPSYERNQDKLPDPTPDDDENDYFWLGGK